MVKPSGKKILIIDDDKALIKMLRSSFMLNGYEVFGASTGEEGLQTIQEKKPDVVILDVILPGMKGRQVCAKIKENPETKDIPVLFLTSKDSPDDIKAEMEAGAALHLTKPVNSQKLLEEIKKIVGP